MYEQSAQQYMIYASPSFILKKKAWEKCVGSLEPDGAIAETLMPTQGEVTKA